MYRDCYCTLCGSFLPLDDVDRHERGRQHQSRLKEYNRRRNKDSVAVAASDDKNVRRRNRRRNKGGVAIAASDDKNARWGKGHIVMWKEMYTNESSKSLFECLLLDDTKVCSLETLKEFYEKQLSIHSSIDIQLDEPNNDEPSTNEKTNDSNDNNGNNNTSSTTSPPERVFYIHRYFTKYNKLVYHRCDYERFLNNPHLPIHYVCNHPERFPLSIVRFFLDKYPESIEIVTPGKKELPLHLACGIYNSSTNTNPGSSSNDQSNTDHNLDIIKYLIQLYPEAIHIKDKFGCIPLHHAVQSGAPIDIIKFLVETDPTTVLTTVLTRPNNGKFNYKYDTHTFGTPYDFATRRENPTHPCSAKVQRYLRFMTAIYLKDKYELSSINMFYEELQCDPVTIVSQLSKTSTY